MKPRTYSGIFDSAACTVRIDSKSPNSDDVAIIESFLKDPSAWTPKHKHIKHQCFERSKDDAKKLEAASIHVLGIKSIISLDSIFEILQSVQNKILEEE